MSDALRASIAAATTAAHRFYSDGNPNSASTLDALLGKLVQLTNSLDPAARLSTNDAHLCELLYYCSVLLNALSTSAVTRSRLHLLLFNLSFHNIAVRKYLAGDDLQICGSVFECLRLSLRDQLGPQNLIDVLRLLQVLTYEKTVVLGIWTNNLISFLLSEVSCEAEPEWLPYCMAILCNLATRSKSVCQRIRRSSSYKAFSHKLLKLLAHDSRTVVISSLVLVGFLEEKLRDTVYCSRNIPQTFQCVFNVLILGDHLMTRHIAVDLLKRLVINDTPTVSSTPVITSTGKDLTSYPFFEHTIQLVAGLLVQIDPRTEESLKVYDLFLSFCSISQLRTPIAGAVLRCPPTEERLTTPILAICNTARLSFEEAVRPEVPLKAMRLLICLFQESLENGGRIPNSVPVEHVLQLTENSTKTAIETVSDCVTFQCQRITEGLRLAETLSNDDDVRADLLEVITAPLCSHIIESQMISNPVVAYMGQPASQRPESLPEWCMDGVAIVLVLLRVLAALKDYSKMHKDLYWKLLKDDRLIPFIAYAVAYGGNELTHEALVLYTHCAQIHAFPTKWLGDLIASCPKEGNAQSSLAKNRLSRSASESYLNGEADGASMEGRKTPDGHLNSNGESSKQVDELLYKLRQGVDFKDPRVSQLLNVYERKILLLKLRERELEKMVAKKEDSLRQSERLRNLYSSQENEDEITNLRKWITDCEKKIEESNALLTSLDAEKKETQEMCDNYKKMVEEKEMEMALLSDELAKMTQEKNILEEENKSEREFVTLTKNRYDELKKKFDQTSTALIDKDKECTQVVNELKMLKRNLTAKEAENNEMVVNLRRVEKEMEDMKNKTTSEMEKLRNTLDEKVVEIDRLSKELQKVSEFKHQMMRMMNEI